MSSNIFPKYSNSIKNSGFKLKKSLGQNYIFDTNLTNKIVKYSLPLSQTIIEVGPGPGTLTKSILESGTSSLFAIEKDKDCIDLLNPLKKLFNNQLTIINADALDFPLWDLGTYPRQIIANLPYNISTKILINLLKNIKSFEKLTLMFQKEVALRMIAKPREKSYGRLSVLVQLLTKPKILFDISNDAFIPKPKVTSSVVELIPIQKSPYKFNLNHIEKLTQLMFSKRRKMLRSILKEYGGEKMLNEIGISPKKRPEDLLIKEFCILSENIYNK